MECSALAKGQRSVRIVPVLAGLWLSMLAGAQPREGVHYERLRETMQMAAGEVVEKSEALERLYLAMKELELASKAHMLVC